MTLSIPARAASRRAVSIAPGAGADVGRQKLLGNVHPNRVALESAKPAPQRQSGVNRTLQKALLEPLDAVYTLVSCHPFSDETLNDWVVQPASRPINVVVGGPIVRDALSFLRPRAFGGGLSPLCFSMSYVMGISRRKRASFHGLSDVGIPGKVELFVKSSIGCHRRLPFSWRRYNLFIF